MERQINIEKIAAEAGISKEKAAIALDVTLAEFVYTIAGVHLAGGSLDKTGYSTPPPPHEYTLYIAKLAQIEESQAKIVVAVTSKLFVGLGLEALAPRG